MVGPWSSLGRLVPGMRRTSHATALALSLLALMAAPALACPGANGRELQAAERIAVRLQHRQAPGVEDAAALLGRARHSCQHARFALAVVVATSRHGGARVGRRYVIDGVRLRGTRIDGVVAYRLDVPAQLRQTRIEVARQFARRTRGGWWWSSDPTRPTYDPAMQAAAASLLEVRSPADARAALAAAATPRATRTTWSLNALDAISSAVQLCSVARRLGDTSSTHVANRLARGAAVRLRHASRGGWSRVDGTWSTLPEHRQLIRLATRLQASMPSVALEATIAGLQSQLVSQPKVTYHQLPAAAFYPLPVDGAFDTSVVMVAVDKPVDLLVQVFDPSTAVLVRSINLAAVPGGTAISWDGRSDAGLTLAPGSYRYQLRAVDRAGNRSVVAGPREFRIARDEQAPKVRRAAVTLRGSSLSTRVLQVRWITDERISPVMHARLRLSGPGGARRAVTIERRGPRSTARVRVHMHAGLWTTRLVISDGSGNAAVAVRGRLVVGPA